MLIKPARFAKPKTISTSFYRLAVFSVLFAVYLHNALANFVAYGKLIGNFNHLRS